MALALSLIALLSLVNVSAYQTAAVTARTTMTVTNSSNAALSVAAGPGNARNQVRTTAHGQVQIDFRLGAGGRVSGFRASDVYHMRRVLMVTNSLSADPKGIDCHDVSVFVSEGTPTNLTEIRGWLTTGAPTGSIQLWSAAAGRLTNRVKLGTTAATNQMYVEFRWSAGTDVSQAGNFTLAVEGTKSTTCP